VQGRFKVRFGALYAIGPIGFFRDGRKFKVIMSAAPPIGQRTVRRGPIKSTTWKELIMDCPQCREPMQNRPIGGILVYECELCRGIWFDPGEIDELKDELSPELRWLDFKIWRRKARFQVKFDPLSCPRCHDIPLTTLTEEESQASLRFCTRCRGSWVQAVDLARIVEALVRELDAKTTSDYIQASLKQALALFTGDKDLISEWHDLQAVLRLLKHRFFVENPKLDSLLQVLQKAMPL
jgi:Zn-finger nucleic acid-binding protein